jgi:deoxyribonuclease IV
MLRFMKLGAHTSVAGGLYRAIERSEVFAGTALQIFSKNNNRWDAPPLASADVERWKSALESSPIDAVAIHDSYLINLCATDPVTFARSLAAFADEHRRAAELGIRLLNFHPGAACGRDRDEAIAIVAESINRVHEETEGLDTVSVIETTAGQGTTLGYRFEEIAAMIAAIDDKRRVAVCVDTCHLFAAGYEIHTDAGFDRVFEEFDAVIGLQHLVLFHLNDSKAAFGSRVDRHEHIGKGQIGELAFRRLMADERFVDVPMVIETPKGKDLAEDIENLALLRSFIPEALGVGVEA